MFSNLLKFSQRIGAIIFAFVSVLILSMSSIPVSAQSQCQVYNPNLPNFGLKCIPLFNNFQGNKEGISGLIIKVADYGIFILATLGVLMIIYAGFLIITDGGSGERSGKGRKIVFNVIIGIIIAVASYTIVSFVSGFITSIDLSNPTGGSNAGNTIQ
jgi:hypothetical protein